MAEIKSKQSEQRVALESVIPLSTPFELQVAVANTCNFKCRYCPCSRPDLLRRHKVRKGLMEYDLFTKLIDDLKGFPEPLKVLRLVKEGEPLMHPRFADMVRYAKQHQPAVTVDTTTNAILLTRPVSDALIDAGLDKIFISLQGMNADAYRRLAQVTVDFDEIVDNIRYFSEHRRSCKVYIKVPDIGVTPAEEQEFFAFFDALADELFVEHIIPTWPGLDLTGIMNADGKGLYGNPLTETLVQVCPIIFYNMNVDFDGTIAACQLDWAHLTSLGSAREQALADLWNGAALNDLRRQHLRGERFAHRLCSQCEALQYCNVDNIDAHADMLLDKFKSLP